MLHHLLVPLDGTPASEETLPVAAALAKQSSARVTLLHVIEHDAPQSIHGQPHLHEAGAAESYLERIAANAFAEETTVDWHVHGRGVRDVAHSVIDHAEEMEPELVIIRAHGEDKLRNWLFGTIPQQIVSHGTIPVLLLQPDTTGTIRFPFRNILVPLDGKPDHERALGMAGELARLFDATLHLITVVPTVDRLSGTTAVAGSFLPESTRMILNLEVEQASQYLLQHVGKLTHEGCRAKAHVLRGEPLEMIIQSAEAIKADLVCLGTHGKAGTHAFWSGSVAQRLIHNIPTSFLLAPARVDIPHE